jgi:hypothetical protein
MSTGRLLPTLSVETQTITLVDLEADSKMKDRYACKLLKGRHEIVGRNGQI